MRQRWSRVLAAAAAPIAALTLSAAPADATPGTVYPGMQIIQDTKACTVGFVDPVARVAYTAGHCRGGGVVQDTAGNVVGTQLSFQNNTPDGATIDTDHWVADWETISLAPDAAVSTVLPGGRTLVADPALAPSPGLAVCHFGVVSGESCGTIRAVYSDWFTMADGVVSQKGDSGGPVYVVKPDGRAAIVGMFSFVWGQDPAAMSWRAVSDQAGANVVSAASGSVGAAPTPVP